MPKSHADYIHSITVKTDDLAVVHCLRCLAQYSQRSGNNRMQWADTSDQHWNRDGHAVTFRFTTAGYREAFLTEARRLLPDGTFEVVGKRGDDAAASQV